MRSWFNSRRLGTTSLQPHLQCFQRRKTREQVNGDLRHQSERQISVTGSSSNAETEDEHGGRKRTSRWPGTLGERGRQLGGVLEYLRS